MQNIFNLLALAAALMSAYYWGISSHIENIDGRLVEIEILAEKAQLNDRIHEVEKWIRSRCLSIPVTKACEEIKATK